MRTDVVIFILKLSKALLLPVQVGAWRRGRFRLERQVEAFMTPILFGTAGLNPVRANTEADPPDGEAAETCQAGGCKGWSVVGADCLW
jgi:hypothetical protein